MSLIRVNWRPAPGPLRTFGLLLAIVLAAAAAHVHGHGKIAGLSLSPPAAAWLVRALAAGAGLAVALGLARPRVLRPLFVAMSAIGLPVGFVLSHIVLAAIFYLLFAPVGLAARAIGWDPMQRRPVPGAKSHWIRRARDASPRRYFRQY